MLRIAGQCVAGQATTAASAWVARTCRASGGSGGVRASSSSSESESGRDVKPKTVLVTTREGIKGRVIRVGLMGHNAHRRNVITFLAALKEGLRAQGKNVA